MLHSPTSIIIVMGMVAALISTDVLETVLTTLPHFVRGVMPILSTSHATKDGPRDKDPSLLMYTKTQKQKIIKDSK